MPFPGTLAWSETQAASYKIWTQVTHYDNNYYAKCASMYITSWKYLKMDVHLQMTYRTHKSNVHKFFNLLMISYINKWPYTKLSFVNIVLPINKYMPVV